MNVLGSTICLFERADLFKSVAPNDRITQLCTISEARIIGVITEQTKVILFAKRLHGPIIRLSSSDHEHQQYRQFFLLFVMLYALNVFK